MRELIERLPHVYLGDVHELLLLDTCFVVSEAATHRLSELNGPRRIGMTTFNLQEIAHIEHRLDVHVRHALRELLKHPSFVALQVPATPGDWDAQRAFVRSVDNALLQAIPDASDAVLIAAAIATRSDVLTKDRHHLYTSVLANLLQERGIHVWKEWKDALQ